MYTLSACRQLINERIKAIVLPQEPSNLFDPIRYMLNLGGKRIRPALMIMSANLYSEDIEPAIYPALAIEVFHNFTLMHDDIMDRASLRRNQPTVHLKWNDNIGILSGDAMLIKAYELLSMSPASCMGKLFALFNTMAVGVCEGQQFDMDFEQMDDIMPDIYLNMIRLKTAVLIAGSMEMGAIVGGSSKADAKLLFNFGINLGTAFQIQDDLLDLYGDPEKFGKDIGNDIVSNKKTFLLIQAMQQGSEEDRDILKQLINKKTFDRDEKIRSVRAIYDRLGIREIAMDRIRTYHNEGLASLDQIHVEKGRKYELIKAMDSLLKRTQ